MILYGFKESRTFREVTDTEVDESTCQGQQVKQTSPRSQTVCLKSKTRTSASFVNNRLHLLL